MSRSAEPPSAPRQRLFPKALPFLAAFTATAIGLLLVFVDCRFGNRETSGLLRGFLILLSVVVGTVGGIAVHFMQKCNSRRRDLLFVNRELERINQQLKTETQRVVQSEERLRLLFSSNPYPMWVFNCDTFRFTSVNDAALRQYGYTREEFLNLTALDLRPPEEASKFLTRLRDRDQGYGARGVWLHRRKDNSLLRVEIGAFRFERDGATLDLVLAQDVTARTEAEEALLRSQAALKSMVDNAPFGICSTSLRENRFLDFNPALAGILGGYTRDEMFSLQLSTQVYAEPGERDRMIELLNRTRKINAFETTLRKKDGALIRVRMWGVLQSDSGKDPDVFNVYLEDITEHSTLEQQVRQVQKLEAVGRLAGGIAHDFNNILVVIRLSTELMLGKVTPESPLTHSLLQVLNASDRAAALTRQLLAFGRQQVMQTRTVNLNTVVTDTMELLRRTIGEDIHLVTELCEELHSTRVDPDQMAQVIMNLAINSRDAMPEGGTLQIETLNVELESTYISSHGPVQPGRYVLLVVSDSGSGMDKSILPRIFDPFFTTKELGKGTGLGLSIVYGIVKQSGGYIWVYSEPGQGTTFKLYFPVTGAQLDVPLQHAELSAPAGEKTILIVEDEAEIRQNVRECLQQLGFKVLEASDGIHALKLVQERREVIDLIITDLVMPRMGGHELSTQVAALDPNIAFLFISGYTEDNAARRDMLSKGSCFLMKPFTVADISQAVDRAIALQSVSNRTREAAT